MENPFIGKWSMHSPATSTGWQACNRHRLRFGEAGLA